MQACYERKEFEHHKEIFWSMENYTQDDLNFFRNKGILPFNAGCFMFRTSKEMEEHFINVRKMIIECRKQKKMYFYEQAFMNVYFNKRDLVKYDIINPQTYVMFPDLREHYKNKIIHFCGTPGNGRNKYEVMQQYIKSHNIFQSSNNLVFNLEKKKSERNARNMLLL